jgi:hypothetical protein
VMWRMLPVKDPAGLWVVGEGHEHLSSIVLCVTTRRWRHSGLFRRASECKRGMAASSQPSTGSWSPAVTFRCSA